MGKCRYVRGQYAFALKSGTALYANTKACFFANENNIYFLGDFI